MEATPAQKLLSTEQVEAFHHDQFVEDQTRHFTLLLPEGRASKVIVDLGGGCGFFARRLAQMTGRRVKVVDMDGASVKACRQAGVEAELGDALHPRISGDEDVACFNLILHHLVGRSEDVTAELQRKALIVWRPHVRAVFVNEYIYESYVGNLSGWLIYRITKSALLSWIGKKVSVVVPALKANTFGVGVRFRAHDEWKRLFAAAGYAVKSAATGEEEHVSAVLRLLLIKHIRRDSFVLEPVALR